MSNDTSARDLIEMADAAFIQNSTITFTPMAWHILRVHIARLEAKANRSPLIAALMAKEDSPPT